MNGLWCICKEVWYKVLVDAFANKISDMSPMGKALIGKKAGDEVTVDAPGGAIRLRIVEVSR